MKANRNFNLNNVNQLIAKPEDPSSRFQITACGKPVFNLNGLVETSSGTASCDNPSPKVLYQIVSSARRCWNDNAMTVLPLIGARFFLPGLICLQAHPSLSVLGPSQPQGQRTNSPVETTTASRIQRSHLLAAKPCGNGQEVSGMSIYTIHTCKVAFKQLVVRHQCCNLLSNVVSRAFNTQLAKYLQQCCKLAV